MQWTRPGLRCIYFDHKYLYAYILHPLLGAIMMLVTTPPWLSEAACWVPVTLLAQHVAVLKSEASG